MQLNRTFSMCYPSMVFTFLTLISFSLSAQNDDGIGKYIDDELSFKSRKVSILKTSPTSLIAGQIPFLGEIRIVYEQVVAPKQTALVGASFNYPNWITRLILDQVEDSLGTNLGAWGLRGQLGYKFYPFNRWSEPHGIWIAPHFSYNFARITDQDNRDDQADIIFMNGSVLIGWQVIADSGFTFELFTGGGYRSNYILYNEDSSGNQDREDIIQGFKPSFGAHIGYAF